MSLLDRSLHTVSYDARTGGYYYSGGGTVVGYAAPCATPSHTHELALHEHFLRHYTPGSGDHVLELGAGVGTETLGLARLVGSAGRVVAVEANPRVAAVLRETLRRNGIENVDVFETAIGDFEGHVEFEDTENDASGHVRADAASNRSLRVPITTLDELVARAGMTRIDFLKSNIEGGELPALRESSAAIDLTSHAAISCHDFKVTWTSDEFFRTKAAVESILVARGFELLKPPGSAEAASRRDTVFARRRLDKSPGPGTRREIT